MVVHSFIYLEIEIVMINETRAIPLLCIDIK
jgi:hypothetical protein